MAVIVDQLLACSDATRGVELDLLVPLPPYFDHVEEEVRRGGGVIEISQEAAIAGVRWQPNAGREGRWVGGWVGGSSGSEGRGRESARAIGDGEAAGD